MCCQNIGTDLTRLSGETDEYSTWYYLFLAIEWEAKVLKDQDWIDQFSITVQASSVMLKLMNCFGKNGMVKIAQTWKNKKI